jgi:hypothetical protein
VYFNICSGGQTLQAFTSQAAYIAAQDATNFGILQLQIVGRKLTGGFYDLNGAKKDSFLISKDVAGAEDLNKDAKDFWGVRRVFETNIIMMRMLLLVVVPT